MATITRNDYDHAFWRYWDTARDTFPNLVYMNFPSFNNFTGCIPRYSKRTKLHTITEKAMRRIEIINGPYAKTLLTIYAIQHGLVRK